MLIFYEEMISNIECLVAKLELFRKDDPFIIKLYNETQSTLNSFLNEITKLISSNNYILKSYRTNCLKIIKLFDEIEFDTTFQIKKCCFFTF